MSDDQSATCTARPCVVCNELGHLLGEVCEPSACRIRRVNLGMACRRCYDHMADQLRELPELYALAAGELHLGTGGGGPRSTEASIGLRVAALDLRAGADVLGVLGSWAVEWAEHYDEPAPDWTRRTRHRSDPVGATLVSLTGHLLAGLHRVCTSHLGVDTFAQELNDLHSAARTAARTAGRSQKIVDCPADSTDGPCGAALRITGLELTDVVYCRRCGSRWDVHRLLLVAASDAVATVWLPVEDVALLLSISPATLKRWAKAGRVRREHGRFDLASVRDAIRTGGRRADLAADGA